MTNQTSLRFFWNGIKVGNGKLQTCFYSNGALLRHPAGTITIYHKEHVGRFSKEIAEQFAIENDTDSMTDYFESDRIRVLPTHPLYAAVKAALDAREARYAAKRAAYEAKLAARRATYSQTV